MTATSADERALLAAVTASPDDDLPRLVYADWLDENAGYVCGKCLGTQLNDIGHPKGPIPCAFCHAVERVSDGRRERAEFIRVQVELARAEERGCPGQTPEGGWVNALRRRERELLTPDRAGEWVGLAGWKVHRGDFEPPTVRFYLERDRQNDGLYVEFHRGFPAEVAADVRTLFGGPCGTCEARTGEYRHPADDPTNQRLEGDTWYTCMTCRGTGRAGGVGGRLLAACPTIERVTVTDVQPVRLPPGWVFEDRDDVPAPIRSVIGRTHRTRDAAHAALSAAVLALLRERAKGVTG